MSTLSPAERKDLRARAHHLDPVVMIGDAGLTDAVMAEIERALASHGLIKVRVAGDDRDARGEAMARIARDTGAQPVQIIGKLLVLYRADGDAQAAKAAPKPARSKLTAARPRGVAQEPSGTGRTGAAFARQPRSRNDKAFWEGKHENRARRAGGEAAPTAARRRAGTAATPVGGTASRTGAPPRAGGSARTGSPTRAGGPLRAGPPRAGAATGPAVRAPAARAPRSGPPRSGAPRPPRDGSARPNGRPARTTEGAVRGDGFGRRAVGDAPRRGDEAPDARRPVGRRPGPAPGSRPPGAGAPRRAASAPGSRRAPAEGDTARPTGPRSPRAPRRGADADAAPARLARGGAGSNRGGASTDTRSRAAVGEGAPRRPAASRVRDGAAPRPRSAAARPPAGGAGAARRGGATAGGPARPPAAPRGPRKPPRR